MHFWSLENSKLEEHVYINKTLVTFLFYFYQEKSFHRQNAIFLAFTFLETLKMGICIKIRGLIVTNMQ